MRGGAEGRLEFFRKFIRFGAAILPLGYLWSLKISKQSIFTFLPYVSALWFLHTLFSPLLNLRQRFWLNTCFAILPSCPLSCLSSLFLFLFLSPVVLHHILAASVLFLFSPPFSSSCASSLFLPLAKAINPQPVAGSAPTSILSNNPQSTELHNVDFATKKVLTWERPFILYDNNKLLKTPAHYFSYFKKSSTKIRQIWLQCRSAGIWFWIHLFYLIRYIS